MTMSWTYLIISVLVNAFGAFLIKREMNRLGAAPLVNLGNAVAYFWCLLKTPGAFGGALLLFAAPIFYMLALRNMPVSIAYPVLIALNFLVVCSLAVAFLKEKLTPRKIGGTILILMSLWLLGGR